MDGRRNSTDLLTSIVAHQDGYRRVQQTQYTRPRSSYLGNRLITRSSHLVRKPAVEFTPHRRHQNGYCEIPPTWSPLAILFINSCEGGIMD
ncbi:hypothetical protein M0802_011344 [Mischocyttarus mexicanus]|nr:hypothetical protein M0802_011344 [Mischocyttarus mexicanus]